MLRVTLRITIRQFAQTSRYLTCVIAILAGNALGEESPVTPPPAWQQEVRITWAEVPLAEALAPLRELHQLPLMLDRRIDPSQPVSGQWTDTRVYDVARDVADQCDFEIAVLPELLYLGPPATTEWLSTAIEIQRERVRTLPAPLRRRWTARQAADWPEPTIPRDLVVAWCEKAQISCAGADLVPHDLWAAGNLPPLDLTARLIVVLAGFDQTINVQADGSVQIIPWNPTARWHHPLRLAQPSAAALKQWQAQFPEATATRRGRQWEVDGTWAAIATFPGRRPGDPDNPAPSSAPRTSPTPPVANETTARFTLRVENQRLDKILDALTSQIQFQVVWSREAEPHRARRCSIDVQQASLAQILDQLLEGTTLTSEMDAQQKQLTIGETQSPR